MKFTKIIIFLWVGALVRAESSSDAHMQKLLKQKEGTEEFVSFYSKNDEYDAKMIMRKGILMRKPQAKATILFCHGFMCDKFDARCLRHIFSDYNTLLFDFRAHGEHIQGQCCSFGKNEAYDVIGAVNFIKNDPELSKVPLIVYGFSMGAGASILAQSIDPTLFKAAIWDCPFESTHQLLGRSIEHLSINLFGYEFKIPVMIRTILHKYAYHKYVQELFKIALKTVSKMDSTPIATCIGRFSPEDAAAKVTIPALFISCAHDDKTPCTAVRRVYDRSQGFKRLWITPGRQHFDSYFYNPEIYKYKINKFIRSILDNSFTTKNHEKIIDDSERIL